MLTATRTECQQRHERLTSDCLDAINQIDAMEAEKHEQTARALARIRWGGAINSIELLSLVGLKNRREQ